MIGFIISTSIEGDKEISHSHIQSSFPMSMIQGSALSFASLFMKAGQETKLQYHHLFTQKDFTKLLSFLIDVQKLRLLTLSF